MEELESDATGGDLHHGGEVLKVVATAALESDGLGDQHVGLATRLALGVDLGRLALALGVGALVRVFLVASALGGLVEVKLGGQVSRVELVDRVASLRLQLQTTAEVVVLASRAALTSVQLDTNKRILQLDKHIISNLRKKKSTCTLKLVAMSSPWETAQRLGVLNSSVVSWL